MIFIPKEGLAKEKDGDEEELPQQDVRLKEDMLYKNQNIVRKFLDAIQFLI